MADPQEIISLFGSIGIRDNLSPGLADIETKLDGFVARMDRAGQNMTNFGNGITGAANVAGGLFGGAITQAANFGTSMTDTQAVLGRTDAEMAELNKEILRIGANSRAGPQATALAFYNIVGSVQDTSTHMGILNESIATSEAGNADLAVTTAALTGTMNAYGYEAEQVGYVSDVLTTIVDQGAGTMNEFAAAMPAITSDAALLGISFGDLGAMVAFSTTEGKSASAATTELSGAMNAMLNPNEAMKEGLSALGFESGAAAVEQLGLAGAYQALADKFGTNAIAPMTGSVEAMGGATSLTNARFNEFAENFTTGITGATDAARAIQNDNPAAQWQLLQSEFAATTITIGNQLLPILSDLMKEVSPILLAIGDWIEANPELTIGLAGITAAGLVLGPIIAGVSTVVGVAATLAGGFATAVGLGGVALSGLLLPLGLAAGAIWGVNRAWDHFVGKNIAGNVQILNDGLTAGKWTWGDLANATLTAIGQEFAPRAGGGPVIAGQPYRVGEMGPEAFIPETNGTIMPSANTGGAGGGMTFNITINGGDA
ncbi:MAG: phage tail tape measure protein, partial [Notoacmeibacter sp.]